MINDNDFTLTQTTWYQSDNSTQLHNYLLNQLTLGFHLLRIWSITSPK